MKKERGAIAGGGKKNLKREEQLRRRETRTIGGGKCFGEKASKTIKKPPMLREIPKKGKEG